MRGIHLGTGRHAEALAHLFHFLLQGRAQPHVRVGKAAVDLAELIRQRHVRIRFFSRFDPQIEQGARAGQLAATGFVFAQLAFEARKRLVDRCLELLGIGLRLRLEILLRAGQGLPARLMIAIESEGRHLQPGGIVFAPALQRLRGFLQPRIEAALAAATQRARRPLHQLLALPLHGVPPGVGDCAGGGIAPGELRGHLLHGAVPIAGLGAEAVDRLLRLRGGLRGQHLRPPVDRLAPVLRRLASRARRRLRGGSGLAVAHGISPGAPVLARLVFEVAVVRTAGCHRPLPWLVHPAILPRVFRRTGQGLGMRSVLLIISEPDTANSSTSGWNCHRPSCHCPHHNV